MILSNTDNMKIINEARRYAKLIKDNEAQGGTKIAVIGSCAIQYFTMVLRYLLHVGGLDCQIYEGEYNGISMDVLNPDSELYKFQPKYVIVLTHYSDIKEFPLLQDDENTIRGLIDNTLKYYSAVWSNLSRIKDVVIAQSNFTIPPEHILGNIEFQSTYSRTMFYKGLNDGLCANAPSNVTIVDIDSITGFYGKYSWFDYKSYFLNKAPCAVEHLVSLAEPFKKIVLANEGKIKKCIVLDLDNTLWGGVVADEGANGIQLDPNNAVGEAYRYFQSYLLQLKHRGVILAVCSKNDENLAKEPFEKNPNMILHLDDIACFVANWENKADNIRRIAKELNIGVDSLVFFDDNPAERDIVRQFVPECHVVDVPIDPSDYAIQLDREDLFEWLQITKEDLLRNNSYIENRNRVQMESSFVDYNEYLKALEMKGSVDILTETDAPRFTQLLNKSNQFNLRTQRYNESEILNCISDENSACLYVKLRDKFSEFGIISCVVLKKEKQDCFIESWVMSCRVLKRNVEDLMFLGIIETAIKMGCKRLVGEYIPTAKNGMVSMFYDSLGFEMFESINGVKKYYFDLTKPVKYKTLLIERE